MKTLWVGNLTAAIVMDEPGREPYVRTPAQQAKCAAQSARLLWLCERGDALLLARAPDEVFQSYVADVLGFRSSVYTPGTVHLDDARSVVEAALSDTVLLGTLTWLGAAGSWQMRPFVQDPIVHALATSVGIPVVGMDAGSVRRGVATQLNDKHAFQGQCRKIGIAVPRSVFLAQNELQLFVAAAEETLRQNGRAVVRQTTAAGGLGNMRIDSREGIEAAQQLVMSGAVLVEPFYQFDATPTVLMRVVGGEPRVIAVVAREVNGALSSTGGLMPVDLEDGVVSWLIAGSLQYAKLVARTIIDGDLDIDWGICREPGGGLQMLALESNCRMTGTGPVVAVRDRLYTEGPVFSWNCDSLPVGDASFEEVRRLFGHQDLLWKTGEGAVIMTPPHEGRMGIAVFARTADRRDTLRQQVCRHAQYVKAKLRVIEHDSK